MSDISDVIGGGTPSTTDPTNFGRDVRWITPADMSGHSGKLISKGDRSLSLKGLSASGARWLPAGSILFSSRAPIGYVAIAAQTVTTNQGFKSFVPRHGICSTYVYYWLSSSKERAEKLASGTTFLELSGAKASLLPIPLAPEHEQTRIVTKLEELLSDLDAGVAELKTAQKKLNQYRQSLLKAAVEGALTADWRARHTPQESGAQLLARILTERRRRWEDKQRAKFAAQRKPPPKNWQTKYPEPVVPNTANLPELPAGWVWASLDQLTEFVTSGSRGWAEYYSDEGATFIRSQNINKDILDLTDIAFVQPPKSSEGVRTRVQRWDLLLTITGANVGKAAHVDLNLEEAYVSQHVALIRMVEIGVAKYLHSFLTASAGGRGQLDRAAYGAGKPGLNLQQVAAVVLPLPSPKEMPVLMETLAVQLGALENQGQSIIEMLKYASAQRKNLLKAAFAGQLVPQDPTDEPASVLLERIRAQRSTSTNIGPRRKSAPVRSGT